MTLNEYQIAALRTAPTPDSSAQSRVNDLLHGALGAGTEAGELLDIVKRLKFYPGYVAEWTHVKEEIGDVLWYCALLCRAAGVSLDDVAQANVAKLKARYPQKFNGESALNRDLGKEREALESN